MVLDNIEISISKEMKIPYGELEEVNILIDVDPFKYLIFYPEGYRSVEEFGTNRVDIYTYKRIKSDQLFIYVTDSNSGTAICIISSNE